MIKSNIFLSYLTPICLYLMIEIHSDRICLQNTAGI